ncbi:MAG TPA: glycosyltransferase family 2 protein [Rhizomicrobium sp.]|nr:glycosyltransferase family 2 protein [Rhizomicrobium sp.]
MTKEPAVSVIVASYNARQFIAEAVRSVQSQTLRDWELVLVDDASQDGTFEQAREIARTDARLRCFRQDFNLGPAAARNRAIREARGNWIAIFDSDDVMSPERLQRLCEVSMSENAPIVADNLRVFGARAPRGRPFLSMWRTRRAFDLSQFIDSNRLYSRLPNLGYLKPFVERAFLRDCGVRYDESLRIGEDYDFLARLLARGAKLRFVPDPLYGYRRRPQSASWRLRGEDIEALLKAHEGLSREDGADDPAVLRALARRKRSLTTLLQFDRVVSLIKAGELARAAALAARAPHMWPLLTRPVTARLLRLWRPRPRESRPADGLAAKPRRRESVPS